MAEGHLGVWAVPRPQYDKHKVVYLKFVELPRYL